MSTVPEQGKENEMKAAWKYIEEHHKEYGVALFIVPVLLCACAVAGVGWFLAWVLQ